MQYFSYMDVDRKYLELVEDIEQNEQRENRQQERQTRGGWRMTDGKKMQNEVNERFA